MIDYYDLIVDILISILTGMLGINVWQRVNAIKPKEDGGILRAYAIFLVCLSVYFIIAAYGVIRDRI